jgi:hypothetical protein
MYTCFFRIDMKMLRTGKVRLLLLRKKPLWHGGYDRKCMADV